MAQLQLPVSGAPSYVLCHLDQSEFGHIPCNYQSPICVTDKVLGCWKMRCNIPKSLGYPYEKGNILKCWWSSTRNTFVHSYILQSGAIPLRFHTARLGR